MRFNIAARVELLMTGVCGLVKGSGKIKEGKRELEVYTVTITDDPKNVMKGATEETFYGSQLVAA